MKKILKKTISVCLGFLLIWEFCVFVGADRANEGEQEAIGRPALNCKSAILMEASTGKVLFEQNSDEAMAPASVTKVMTLLLVMEAIEDGRLQYSDTLSASAHACSMGGSQIYLEEGEQMSVEDLIKSVVIASANDAAVVLAEAASGTEDAFVETMNAKARTLEMKNTHFENTNGLDDTATNHVTSARDIAIMSRELIRYPKILEYSSIWMDTIRNGEFGLTNTNRLIRFYKGATGLKTGSTSKAGFCISATAERDNMSLICVIMGAESRDIRNAAACSLLDWGFANYARYDDTESYCAEVPVIGGTQDRCRICGESFSTIVEKADLPNVKKEITISDRVSAPLQKGQKIGSVAYALDGNKIGEADILADETVDRITFWGIWAKILKHMSFPF